MLQTFVGLLAGYESLCRHAGTMLGLLLGEAVFYATPWAALYGLDWLSRRVRRYREVARHDRARAARAAGAEWKSAPRGGQVTDENHIDIGTKGP